jgi:hypothetical protein
MKYGFSRKHYEIVAKAIRNADLPPGYREKIAAEIAEGFIQDNQFFDRKRFMTICMLGESETTTNALREK